MMYLLGHLLPHVLFLCVGVSYVTTTYCLFSVAAILLVCPVSICWFWQFFTKYSCSTPKGSVESYWFPLPPHHALSSGGVFESGSSFMPSSHSRYLSLHNEPMMVLSHKRIPDTFAWSCSAKTYLHYESL